MIFLISINNPFETNPLIFIKYKKEIQIINENKVLKDIIEKEEVVSFGFDNVIEFLRKHDNKIDTRIIDVVSIKKILTGTPKKNINEKGFYNLTNLLKGFIEKETYLWLEKILNFNVIQTEFHLEDHNYLDDLFKGFENLYNTYLDELKLKNEFLRFFDIEVRVYNIFIKSQLIGIKVDKDSLLFRLTTLKLNYYRSLKKLEFDFKFDTSLINSNIKWSDIKDFTNLHEFKNEFEYNFWNSTKNFSELDSFIKLLNEVYLSRKDYNELLKYKIDNYSKIYPIYDIIGTVTSRILIQKPGIQFLKKSNRDIFIPRKGRKFLYADFDQFEPGILVSILNDDNLIRLYNSDIYSELSKNIFNDKSMRKNAKIVFLSYLYGMSLTNIEKFLEKLVGEKGSTDGIEFFEQFQSFEKWKENLIIESEHQGFSSSVFGNSRYLRNIGFSTNEEKRWIPNQKIQGTASYIFKKCLIELDSLGREINILIPMHDAILVEVLDSEADELKLTIKEIFERTFKEICPNINPSISFESFS